MEDKRDLQERKRQRRKNLIKKKKRQKRIRIALIIGAIGLSFFILNRLRNKEVEKKPVLEDSQLEKPSEGPIDEKFAKEKKADLDKRLDNYIKKNKLEEDQLALAYYDLLTGETYLKNPKKEFPAGGTTNLALNFLYYDLAQDGKINLEKTVTSVKEDFENAYGPLAELAPGEKFNMQKLLHTSIGQMDTVSRNVLIRAMEEKTGQAFNQEVFKKYKIRINKDNKLSADQGLKMVKYLEDNKNTNKLYKMIISDMLDKNQDSYASKYIKEKRIYHKPGNMGSSYSDLGMVYGDQPYIFVILTNYNNQEVVSDLSYIINEWHNYYN